MEYTLEELTRMVRVGSGDGFEQAKSVATCFGASLDEVIREVLLLGGHGFLSKGDTAEAVYVLKYLSKAVEMRVGK